MSKTMKSYRRVCDENPYSFRIGRMDSNTEKLFKRLIRAPIDASATTFEIVDAYLRATCVAAGIEWDQALMQDMLLRLAEHSVSTFEVQE